MRLPCAALLLAVAAGCGPSPAPRAPEPSAAERQRAVLLRPGGLFVQLRVDRVRTWLPSLGEIAALAWTPTLPGASCLVDFVWSTEVAAAWLATPGAFAPPSSGIALVRGAQATDERVASWVDCVLGGLGSGVQTRVVPPPAAEPDGPAAAPLPFVVGTGRWRDAGLAPLGDAGAYAVVVGEPFDERARELAGWTAPADAAVPHAADLVADADIQVVWLDTAAVAELLDRGSAGLGPAPPPEELRGLAAGLWLGERPHVEVYIEARGPEAAAAVEEALRTAAAVVQLGVSVRAAQLGRDYGADVQARAEDVAAIAEHAVIGTHDSLAFVHLELTPEQLAALQAFALALVSSGLRE